MQSLEREVKTLSEEFATKLGFIDIETMKEAAYRFKEMLGDDYSESDNSVTDLISPSQKVLTRKSLCVSNLLTSDEEVEKEKRKPRKSRKSVCVLPKMVMSSSEEDESQSDCDDHEATEIDQEEPEKDDSDDDEVLNKQKKKRINYLHSDSEDDDNHNKESDSENLFHEKTKKKIKYFSSGEDEFEESSKEMDLLSQTLQRQTLKDDYSDNEDEDKEDEDGDSEYDSNDDSKGSLKDFIVSDDEDDEGNQESSEESKSETESDSYKSDEEFENDCAKENSDSDFEEQPKPLPKLKTPGPKPVQILKEKNFQKFVTPLSQSRRIINEHCTPKSVPGTPAYKREFNKKREQTVSNLFKLFNKTVFDGKLPNDLEITWNKRMTKTAGFCYYSKSLGVRKCRLELSDKVIDSPERIRDTLIHELCHAATWLINGVQAGHGPAWKHWAKIANKVHPDLPIISRCHQYEINTKYNYKCNGCGATFGRHSKSIDPSKHRCATCGGIPELQGNASSVSATPKTPNAYALFVKEHFATVKKNNPGVSHREIMVMISDKFKKSKASSNKENI